MTKRPGGMERTRRDGPAPTLHPALAEFLQTIGEMAADTVLEKYGWGERTEPTTTPPQEGSAMGTQTGIEWTEHTWNPWVGCRKTSPGCKLCYMFREMRRYGKDPEKIARTSDATFYAPQKWREPAMVFTCSWSDFFLPEADAWRDDAWDVIRRTPHLTYQILTKRVEGMPTRLPADWGNGWPHVWLGVSVERHDYLWRVARLVEIPATVHFLSYEPALGPVDLTPYLGQLEWVISGGESDDEKPRPADPAWFRSVRDQCAQAGVAYFHKQNGGTRRIDGSWGGHLLDGRVHRAFPCARGEGVKKLCDLYNISYG